MQESFANEVNSTTSAKLSSAVN